MYSEANLTDLRITRLLAERLLPALVRESAPLRLTAWEVPDEPVAFDEAVSQSFSEFSVGQQWGKPWGTVWFHVEGAVPIEWDVEGCDIESWVDLGFTALRPGFQAEGLVWSPEGVILKALEPMNSYVPLAARPGDRVNFYVEAAANPDIGRTIELFAPTPLGRKSTAGTQAAYTLRRADIVARDRTVGELIADIEALTTLVHELPNDSTRYAKIMQGLSEAAEKIDPRLVCDTAQAGRDVLAPLLSSPASASAHQAFAVGHAHIDSAWMWPTRETVRKCARTFANVLSLMDRHPEFIFAASSAQQYAWVKEAYPALFERIRERVAEGRFVPVGGMWVESDTNMPSGESLVRQFVEGKRFFREEFGVESEEVWLPDSFGYSAALPQISRAAGMTRFLTQKTSWNETNRMPHHTFDWEGIDGTRIFTHFPPVDTYNSNLSGTDLAHLERNYSEKGTANSSLVPFGFGDGGGGPTREMLAAGKRAASLEGSPTVTLGTPAQFFEQARREMPNPPVWVGELYLEFHRGTFTSQARTKRGNRRSEGLLHEAELWSATASIYFGADYPHEELRSAWRTVLLLQFHDILPGSSIGWVYDQAETEYAELERALETLIARATEAIGGEGDEPVVFNPSPFAIEGVPAFGAGIPSSGEPAAVTVSQGRIVLDNGLVRATLDAQGLLCSFVDLATGREVIPMGHFGNLLELFRDTPSQWDAWDIDKEYRNVGEQLTELAGMQVLESADGTPTVEIKRNIGDSSIRQLVSLPPSSRSIDITTEVDWHERQKLLKLGFPFDIHTTEASSEIQFGHVVRPTHTNTSWDTARFETPAHRWVHVSDASFGAGVANDSTYGHDISRSAKEGPGTISTIRQSLLRAPLFPDPEADQGLHVMRTSVFVGDRESAVEEGYRLNRGLRRVTGKSISPLVSFTNPVIIIETVKLADDESGDLVVRLYESSGAQASGFFSAKMDALAIRRTDVLERAIDVDEALQSSENGVWLSMNAFELVTLRISRVHSPSDL